MRTLYARVAGEEPGTVVVEPVPAIEEAGSGGEPTRYVYVYRADPEASKPGEVIGPYETLDQALEGAQDRFGEKLDAFHTVPIGVDPWQYADTGKVPPKGPEGS
jgi:hypothetical protein